MVTKNSPNIFSPTAPARIPIEMEERIILGYFQQGRMQEAERAARALTQRAPQHGFGWKAWGLILNQLGRKQEALPAMQQAAKLMPNDAEAFNNLGVLFQELEQVAHAESCYRQAISVAPQNKRALNNLIDLLRPQDRRDELLPLLQQKLALEPDNEDVRHQVAMLSGEQTDSAPAGYVATLFDGYADRFDAHLQNELGYAVPARMVELLSTRLNLASGWRVLDLGCGTGLVGEALGTRATQLTGVDLSAKMLDKARERGKYTRLVQADILAHMRQEPAGSVDVVVATDVFIYVGKMDEVVAQAQRLLAPGGVFAFSVEDLAQSQPSPSEADQLRGYRLEPSGRYSHGEAYLRQLAEHHGFELLTHVPLVIRKDKAHDIRGHLLMWRR
jgi:predicted TPR repeat methyltransferase